MRFRTYGSRLRPGVAVPGWGKYKPVRLPKSHGSLMFAGYNI
jgi:hypothetical protein